VTLEAAILLPLFIVGILTLGFSIKIIFADENIGFAASDEARVLGEEAYNIPIAPFFKNNLEKRILKENKHAAAVKVKYFSYLYSQDGVDGLISFQVTCWMESGLPLGMKRGMELKENIKCRGFIGRTAASQPFTFDEMEKNDQSNIVWIFPDGGERYHQNDCTYISSYPLQMVLNESLRSQYKPCDVCHPESMKDGSLVYCFVHYGEVYHMESCPTIDKYVISMEKTQAEDRGYTPCFKCGGTE